MHCFAPYIKVALLAGGLSLLCSCAPADGTFINPLGMSLRFGADQWDLPDLFFDIPDVNDRVEFERGRVKSKKGNPGEN
jgi:hypothetical protein